MLSQCGGKDADQMGGRWMACLGPCSEPVFYRAPMSDGDTECIIYLSSPQSYYCRQGSPSCDNQTNSFIITQYHMNISRSQHAVLDDLL